MSIKAGDYLFTASGSSVKFPGFMALYMSVDEEIANESEQKKPKLPELSQGMILKLDNLAPKQHFTMPPPRFSEASLVKELEENGIGRPSTYASILSTIRGKGYVDLAQRLFPSRVNSASSSMIFWYKISRIYLMSNLPPKWKKIWTGLNQKSLTSCKS